MDAADPRSPARPPAPEPGAGGQMVPVGHAPSPSVTVHLRGNDLLLVPETATALEALPAALRGALRPDARRRGYRAAALLLPAVEAALGARARYDFEARPCLPFPTRVSQAPRPYQAEALAAWQAAGGRGVVVLPTGAGKTFLAVLAVQALGLWTVVLVPTLDLLAQWRAALLAGLQAPADGVGVVGGGAREPRPLTVITYESAARHPRLLTRFGLLVADEVHHLPAPAYRRIAEGAIAPYRLGLSATPERADGGHAALAALIGPEVYRRDPAELARGGHIASYEERRVEVALVREERAQYDAHTRAYRGYLAARGLRVRSAADFERLVLRRSGGDPLAYEALRAHQAARRIAFGARGKLAAVEELLERHRDERVLIFSEYNAAVEELGRRLCLPVIVHTTPPAERRAILERFRAGVYTKLATGRVLNEGVDVPDAAVAIVLSGSGTRREHLQRLGRILRPKAGGAVLYELVTRDTAEPRVARRRRGRGTGIARHDDREAMPRHGQAAGGEATSEHRQPAGWEAGG
jgi:superfamily II DNA or RNA helicase